MIDEPARALALADAQRRAAGLFDRIEHQLIRPGIRETELIRDIADLGRADFGLEKNWHKRIVRAGPNTLAPYDENPPDLLIGEDDIVFVDLGPVFESARSTDGSGWEADFGRTYVLGHDPHKLRLRDDVAAAFADGRRHFETHPDITGSELLAYLVTLAEDAGWEFGGSIAGHLVGEFPHKTQIPENGAIGYADANHHVPMRGLDSLGRQRHWILEIHFVDRVRRIGGFYAELLTV